MESSNRNQMVRVKDTDKEVKAAIRDNNRVLVRTLIANNIEYFTNHNIEISLRMAIQQRNVAMTKLLIEYMPNLEDMNLVYIFWLIFFEKLKDVAEILISKGVNINARGNSGATILHYAISNKNRKIVKLLLERGADVNICNDWGSSSLQEAASTGDVRLINDLIKAGAHVDSVDNMERNVLHYISYHARKEKINAAKVFVEMGIDVNSKDLSDNTPLHLSVSTRKLRLSQYLIKVGSDVNAKNKFGETPLMLAVEFNTSPIVKLLLRKGANINDEDNDGTTALQCAVREEDESTVNILIKAGALIYPRNDEIITPFFFNCPTNGGATHPVIKEFVRLENRDEFVAEADLGMIQYEPRLNNHYETCWSEINNMKTIILFQKYTMHNLLTDNKYEFVKLMRNCLFRKNYRKINLEITFPIWKLDLSYKFNKGQKMLREWNKKRGELTQVFSLYLPVIAIDKISYYLCTE